MICYHQILEFFFRSTTPAPRTAQGNNVGMSYRSAIFYLSGEQKKAAQNTIANEDASGLRPGKVLTEVASAGPLWGAVPEHRDYLERVPIGYICHFPPPDWTLLRRAL